MLEAEALWSLEKVTPAHKICFASQFLITIQDITCSMVHSLACAKRQLAVRCTENWTQHCHIFSKTVVTRFVMMLGCAPILLCMAKQGLLRSIFSFLLLFLVTPKKVRR